MIENELAHRTELAEIESKLGETLVAAGRQFSDGSKYLAITITEGDNIPAVVSMDKETALELAESIVNYFQSETGEEPEEKAKTYMDLLKIRDPKAFEELTAETETLESIDTWLPIVDGTYALETHKTDYSGDFGRITKLEENPGHTVFKVSGRDSRFFMYVYYKNNKVTYKVYRESTGKKLDTVFSGYKDGNDTTFISSGGDTRTAADPFVAAARLLWLLG